MCESKQTFKKGYTISNISIKIVWNQRSSFPLFFQRCILLQDVLFAKEKKISTNFLISRRFRSSEKFRFAHIEPYSFRVRENCACEWLLGTTKTYAKYIKEKGENLPCLFLYKCHLLHKNIFSTVKALQRFNIWWLPQGTLGRGQLNWQTFSLASRGKNEWMMASGCRGSTS